MRHNLSAHWAFQAGLFWLSTFAIQTTALPGPAGVVPPGPHNDGVALQPRSDDNKLQLMPLGASITAGYKSSDGNGYRESLRDKLKDEGWSVNMVGSLKGGDMDDNDHEGHSGKRVDEIVDMADKIVSQKPNLILINLGTNDATQKYFVNTTRQRMDDLLTKLYDGIPGTTVILSTLLVNKFQPTLVQDINRQYRDIVKNRRNKNEKIVLAEMSDNPKLDKLDELVDGTHPTDDGYKKMADAWLPAIMTAQKENMIPKASKKASDDTSSSVKTVTSHTSSSPTPSTIVETNGAAPQFPHQMFLAWVRMFF